MSEEEKIKDAIESIRPHLQADGGDVRFVAYKNGVVSVELLGACGGCPMAKMTLKNGVEAGIREVVPEIKEGVEI
jgi:Fe-S cluster biogenesis protein NfuA